MNQVERQSWNLMKILMLFVLLVTTCSAETAREYYDELYKAGGLDRMADKYVCFDDDKNNPNFFIFGESKDIRDYMIVVGTFAKLSKAEQEQFKNDFLIMRGYSKGIAFDKEQFFDADGNSWVTDPFVLTRKPKTMARMRFTFTRETLRYRREVELINSEFTSGKDHGGYGRCEEISPEITQHGNP